MSDIKAASKSCSPQPKPSSTVVDCSDYVHVKNNVVMPCKNATFNTSLDVGTQAQRQGSTPGNTLLN
eukprot:2769501-Amphidinium_carterae.1